MRLLLRVAVHALLVVVIVATSNRGKALHLPLQRTTRRIYKREHTSVGLGDVLDVTYNVLVQVGETLTPLVMDTGSSDLWILSDKCLPSCTTTGVPRYSQNILTPTGQEVSLLYGDSRTGTHASGPVGTDTVGVAGLTAPNQYFAAIVDTNTSVLETGSAGILGLGFPPISVIWRQLLASKLNWTGPPSYSKRSTLLLSGNTDYRRSLPSFDFLVDPAAKKREDPQLPFASAADSFPTFGPLFTRLVTFSVLSRPLFVTTLQRNTVSLSSHSGTLSLGELPFGLSDEHLTWVPVRGYPPNQGGIPPPAQAPDEVYPLVWEVPIDDVYFDNVKLPRSGLSPPSISLSALVDTGNSLIRGPQDVIAHIFTMLDDPSGSYDCSIPHNLSFQIGGVQFPVDPRDFAQPAPVTPGTVYPDEAARCTPALAATDPPGNGGFLYSWSLGDPFLKSALVAFYYGNMTHPSRDPPRVGFLSTVPANASCALEQAVASAIYNGGVFPSTSEPAPYAKPTTAGHTDARSPAPPEITQGWQRAVSGGASAGLRPPDGTLLLWTSALMSTVLVGVGVLGFL